MTLNEFEKQINGELSQDCQIPFQIPKASLMRTIDLSKKWFYKNYEYAVEECYAYIDRHAIMTDEFNRTLTITLPDTVQSVINVHKVNGAYSLGDFSTERLTQEMLFSGHRYMYDGGGALDFYVIKKIYFDWVNTLLTQEVTYDYNENSHRFKILGENPKSNLVLHCYVKLEEEFLFDDEIFFRYVLANVKINLGRIMGTVKMPLVGEAEIDFDSLKSDGKDELDAIKEDIKGREGVDWFFTQ